MRTYLCFGFLGLERGFRDDLARCPLATSVHDFVHASEATLEAYALATASSLSSVTPCIESGQVAGTERRDDPIATSKHGLPHPCGSWLSQKWMRLEHSSRADGCGDKAASQKDMVTYLAEHGNAGVLQRPRLVGDDSGWRRRCDLDILPRQRRVTRVALLLLWKLGWRCAGRCVGCVGLVYRIVVRGCRERVSPRWWGHGWVERGGHRRWEA